MNKILVITSYPPKGKTHHKNIVGVASYTKNTLNSLKNAAEKQVEITVLAERFSKKANKVYKENGITVKRIWKRNSFGTFAFLTKELLKFHKDKKNVLIELELSMFGNILHLVPLLPFLIMLRILNKKVTVVFHQVILDFRELSGHLNLKPNDWRITILNFSIQIFYSLILSLVSRAIVFDSALKRELARFGEKRKITIIPHGVESFNDVIIKKEAREKLEIPQSSFVLLYFGFIAWYKGADWLVKRIKNSELKIQNKRIKLIVAGGANPNHINKRYYQRYLEDIKNECKIQNISFTGFVKEENIPLYFCASDVVVFPYRAFMSASGPLSLAFAFKKPFLVSDKLSKIFETKDIKNTLKSVKIKKELITFRLDDDDFKKRINSILSSFSLQKKISELAEKVSLKRSWNNIGRLYYDELFIR